MAATVQFSVIELTVILHPDFADVASSWSWITKKADFCRLNRRRELTENYHLGMSIQ